MDEKTEAGPPALPETGYIRQRELIGIPGKAGKPGRLGIVPFSRTTLWRMIKAGTFPAPVKLSPGVTAWRVEAVMAWIGPKMTVESAPTPATGRRKPEVAMGRSAKQRANAASALPARPLRNKALERELVAEAKAWRDAAITRAYVSHLLEEALKGGDRPDEPLLEWFAWAIDVANRSDPAPGRLMKLAQPEAGGA